MGNLITDRVAYFLKDAPPFDLLETTDRSAVAQHITVQFFEKDDYLFQEGAPETNFIYILRQGSVKLLKSENDSYTLVDQCEPGDVFGIRSVLNSQPYSLSAQCSEESLVYALPSNRFTELLNQNQAFSLFFAKGYAAGQVIVRADEDQTSLKAQVTALAHSFRSATCVITCRPDDDIKSCATKMRESNVGSIVVVDEQEQPLGIVTDTDLRNKVVAGGIDIHEPIRKIMSSPVKTIPQHTSISEVIMEMVKSGVHHLIITRDGTDQAQVVGMVSDHDVVVSQQNHPASLIKEIRRSIEPSHWPALRDQAEEMVASYLKQDLSIKLIASTITKINDTLIEKAIEVALKEVEGAGDVSFCWLNLGSEGREEQLLRTDQDNAIIYDDTGNHPHTQEVLLQVAEKVTTQLAACGFEKCPADIMASNPVYCQPLSQWINYFHEWIAAPDPKAVMKATIFFDFRAGWGHAPLAEALATRLVEELKAHGMFLHFLAQNALQNPPPLSFFKNFLVEKSGEHKNEFDIKKRGMMPLSDAARLLLLHHGVTDIQNTPRRFEKLMALEPKNKATYQAAIAAFELFLKHRTLNGLKHQNSGRFLPLDEMSKYDKQRLKNAFLAIKEIQEIISVRFQQSYFS